MRRHNRVPEQLKDCIDEEMRAVGKYAGRTVELEESTEGEKRDAIAATEEMPEEPPGWSLTCMECKGLDVEFEVCALDKQCQRSECYEDEVFPKTPTE